MLDGYNRMFDCTDECWRRGYGECTHTTEPRHRDSDKLLSPRADCEAVIYTGWDKKCKIIKRGHDLKLTNLKAYEPNKPFIAVAVKAEGAWQGACGSRTAQTVPICQSRHSVSFFVQILTAVAY